MPEESLKTQKKNNEVDRMTLIDNDTSNQKVPYINYMELIV